MLAKNNFFKPVFTLANGKQVSIAHISHTGFGRKDTVTWEMQSDEKLTDEEISFLVECEKPSAGYGVSITERVNSPGDTKWRVRVTSWAAC